MKMLPSNSRFSAGILLLIIILGVAASLFTMHNTLLKASIQIPAISVVLLLVSVVCAIILYQRVASISKQATKKSEQLEQLKKSIEQTKAYEKERESLKAKEEKKDVVDHQTEAENLIPKQPAKNVEEYAEILLSAIAKRFDIVQGIVFHKNKKSQKYTFTGGYAYFSEDKPREFIEGETLSGQVAKNKVILNLTNVPENYITILSGLGKGSPKYLLIVPIINKDGDCAGIIELASFKPFGDNEVETLKILGSILENKIENSSQSSNE